MNKKGYLAVLVMLTLLLAVTVVVAQDDSQALKEQVGEALYFDTNLSAQGDVGCVSCHDPEWGFTGPDSAVNEAGAVYPASIPNRWGNRKPPSAAYGGESPVFYYDEAEGLFVGGMFWDGRATGETLGDPLAEQAKGPFLNPVEHGLPNAQTLCVLVREADYAADFAEVWGLAEIDCAQSAGMIYDLVGLTISAYEHSDAVNPFSSKYDYYLAHRAKLTRQEKEGLKLFEGKAMCSACHISGEGAVFTDFTYDNIGVPKNPENPWYEMPAAYNPDGYAWIDYGLGGFLATREDYASMAAENMGKQKVPTLRNVALRPEGDNVKAYTHNGYFKDLYQLVHFYNTRDVKDSCEGAWVTAEEAMAQDCWPAPEVPGDTVNTTELGNLGLSYNEEMALVAFLRTLSDGYVPAK